MTLKDPSEKVMMIKKTKQKRFSLDSRYWMSLSKDSTWCHES